MLELLFFSGLFVASYFCLEPRQKEEPKEYFTVTHKKVDRYQSR